MGVWGGDGGHEWILQPPSFGYLHQPKRRRRTNPYSLIAGFFEISDPFATLFLAPPLKEGAIISEARSHLSWLETPEDVSSLGSHCGPVLRGTEANPL